MHQLNKLSVLLLKFKVINKCILNMKKYTILYFVLIPYLELKLQTVY